MAQSASIKSLLSNRRDLAIVAPHPDDEVFGCGLLIAAARNTGVRITVVILTDGRASHPRSLKWPLAKLVRLRQCETRRGLARLGVGGACVRFMGWRDGALASQGNVARLRDVLIRSGTKIVLVTSPKDFHPDHKAAFALVRRAAEYTRMAVATYEVWSRIDVHAKRARDAGVSRKIWATAAHRSQISNYIDDDATAFRFEPRALRELVTAQERYHILSQTADYRK